MTPKLTEEIRQAIADQPGQPVYLVDTSTQQKYVLLSADTYQKVQVLLYDDGEQFLPLAHEAFVEDWNAPGMDAYDDYDHAHFANGSRKSRS